MTAVRAVSIAKTVRVDFCSKVNRRSYSISVALPLVAPAKTGCPVLYVLDGDWYFGSAVEIARGNAPGVAVVGVGYPDDESYVSGVLERHRPLPIWTRGEAAGRVAIALERMFDLSLPASKEVLAADFPYEWQIGEGQVGGLDAFLKVIETEVKTRVAEMVSIDSSKQAIFGHSLGGLAVLHALFVEPGAFRTFVAASPSIWWNSKAVLGGLDKLADSIGKSASTPRVLLTMGGEEQAADPKMAAKLALEFAEYEALVRRNRMVDNARELTQKLKTMCDSGGFEVGDYVVFPEETHAISPWSALGRAVAFAFPR